VADSKSNRNVKDSVFVDLFKEPKRLIELYNALHGTAYKDDTPVLVETLSDVLFKSRINDLAFVLDGKVVILAEHQSTINFNMPLRFLIYLGRVYERIINHDSVYRYTRMNIPMPEFIVFYNGKEEYPEKSVMKLSDSFLTLPEFEGHFSLELEATVLNINVGQNEQLLQHSETLKGYSIFIGKIRQNIAADLSQEEAFRNAIRDCIKEGILAEYLQKAGSEVENMLFGEWDWDKALDARFLEGAEKGRQEGKQEGKKETLADLARKMLQKGMSYQDILELTGLSGEDLALLQQ
jgi:predicted transposase/invertase (TIGR01784 family)